MPLSLFQARPERFQLEVQRLSSQHFAANKTNYTLIQEFFKLNFKSIVYKQSFLARKEENSSETHNKQLRLNTTDPEDHSENNF